jgi:hypothetical protein
MTENTQTYVYWASKIDADKSIKPGKYTHYKTTAIFDALKRGPKLFGRAFAAPIFHAPTKSLIVWPTWRPDAGAPMFIYYLNSQDVVHGNKIRRIKFAKKEPFTKQSITDAGLKLVMANSDELFHDLALLYKNNKIISMSAAIEMCCNRVW